MYENQDTISDRIFYEAMWFGEARFASIHPPQTRKNFEKLPRFFCATVLGTRSSGAAGEPVEDETQACVLQPRALLGLAQSGLGTE